LRGSIRFLKNNRKPPLRAAFCYYSCMFFNHTARGAWILIGTVVAIGMWVWGGYYLLGDIWFANLMPSDYPRTPKTIASIGGIAIFFIGITLANIKSKSEAVSVQDGVTVDTKDAKSHPAFLRPFYCAIFISAVATLFLGLIFMDAPFESFTPVWITAFVASIVFFIGNFRFYQNTPRIDGTQRLTFKTFSLFYGPLVLLVLLAVGLGFLMSWGKTSYETVVSMLYVGYLLILGMSLVPRSAEKAGISIADLPFPRLVYALSKLGTMLFYATIISGVVYICIVGFAWGSACLSRGC